MTNKNALIIFVKNAEKGKVKTRLASTVGDDQALKIYNALLHHTKDIALSSKTKRYLFYSQEINKHDDWSAKYFQKLLQSNGDLGDRMLNAFKHCLQHHEKAIIIGSDCASLTPDIVQSAFQLLDQHPFVIGPTFDGGYYLLGMSSFTPSLFEDVAWSTETVFTTTIEKIKVLKKSYALLPKLSDIDYEEDWIKYGWELED